MIAASCHVGNPARKRLQSHPIASHNLPTHDTPPKENMKPSTSLASKATSLPTQFVNCCFSLRGSPPFSFKDILSNLGLSCNSMSVAETPMGRGERGQWWSKGGLNSCQRSSREISCLLAKLSLFCCISFPSFCWVGQDCIIYLNIIHISSSSWRSSGVIGWSFTAFNLEKLSSLSQKLSLLVKVFGILEAITGKL